MAKRKPKPFNTEKDVLEGKAIENAPIVGGEFIIPDAKEGELAQGQTIEVKSDTHLEDDHGTGEHVIIRTFEFAINPVAFKEHQPSIQELFESQSKGIKAMLWMDGLTPIEDVAPRITFSKDNTKFFIIVTAKPSIGQTVLDKSFTLSELIKPNAIKRHKNTLHRIV